MAKITEQTERFEDMLNHMKEVVKLGNDLTIEERNLLSVAYKNTVGSRRTAWRALSSIEQKEESKNSNKLSLLRDYKKKVENELNAYCNDIITLLNQNLIPSAGDSNESQVFFMKMKGDYHRYVSEYAQGSQHSEA